MGGENISIRSSATTPSRKRQWSFRFNRLAKIRNPLLFARPELQDDLDFVFLIRMERPGRDLKISKNCGKQGLIVNCKKVKLL